MCIIRFKWREVPVPVVREGNGWVGGWVGGLHLYKKCGIYTIPDWHLYNSTLAFIQFHTGIYTIQHWHLYNSTLAFIEVMSLLRFLPKLFMALCHEWHAQSKCMLSMAECCPIFLFFQTSLGIYTKHYRKGHLYKQNLAFIQ